MALRTGQSGPAWMVKLYWRCFASCGASNDESRTDGSSLLSCCDELSTQNWSGQGESDSLIKTKHCDGVNTWWHNVISAQCSECQSEEIRPSAGKRRPAQWLWSGLQYSPAPGPTFSLFVRNLWFSEGGSLRIASYSWACQCFLSLRCFSFHPSAL